MSLAVRVAIATAALSILTAVLVTSSAIVSTSSGVRADIDDFLRERGDEIADGTRRQPDRGDRRGRGDDDLGDGELDVEELDDEQLAELVEADQPPSASEVDAQVQVLDGDGVVTAATGLDIPITDVTLALVTRDDDGAFETVAIDGVDYRVYTAHVPEGGAVQVATSLEDTSSLLSLLRTRLLLIGAVVALLAAAAGWFVARRALRPLGQLAATAEQVTQTRQLDVQIEVDEVNTEIGRLADSFNSMLGALAQSREQQHQLVQDAAHELRTPLTSVNANVDLLVHATDLPDADRREILTGVQAELRQLRTLFTEIVELATDSHEAVDPRPLTLGEVVEQAVDDLARRTVNPITVEVDTSVVMGDRAALHRAVSNLLSNASKYSPPTSPIHVTVTAGSVSVADRGPGIPLDQRERIFARFHRLEDARPQPGWGLGLAIVAKIVEDHGGQTFVGDTDPGPGAVVGFTLPTV